MSGSVEDTLEVAMAEHRMSIDGSPAKSRVQTENDQTQLKQEILNLELQLQNSEAELSDDDSEMIYNVNTARVSEVHQSIFVPMTDLSASKGRAAKLFSKSNITSQVHYDLTFCSDRQIEIRQH